MEILRNIAQIVEVDRRVATLDPLGMDSFFREFRRWNDLGMVETIVARAAPFIGIARSAEMGREELMAVKRDLAMVVAAIFRYRRPRLGAENPLSLVPGLEALLLELAKRLGELPSLSCYDYCTRNPRGSRERRFTRRRSERLFIDSIRKSMWWQMRTLSWLVRAQEISANPKKGLRVPRYTKVVERANWSFRHVVKIMAAVRRTVSPKEFSIFIRPWFDPQMFGDELFSTASASHSGMLQVDRGAWIRKRIPRSVRAHEQLNLPYQPAAMRELFVIVVGIGSLLGNALAEIERSPSILEDPVVRWSLGSLEILLGSIRAFRFPHTDTVRLNRDVRRKLRMNPKGSGGEDYRAVLKLRKLTDKSWRDAHDLRKRVQAA